LSEEAKRKIAEIGFDPTYGARPLKRAIYDIIEDQLAELILKDELKEGDNVGFEIENDDIIGKVLKNKEDKNE
jgi:ATP-dependent Clp protease ATP-binding subunit ClpB